MYDNERIDIYIIPPNFMESGTFMGGAFKYRNAFEAGFISILIGFPIINLPLSFMVKFIILCFTALPIGTFLLIGIYGEPMSSFLYSGVKYFYNRRIIKAIRSTEAKMEKKRWFRKENNKEDAEKEKGNKFGERKQRQQKRTEDKKER